jgi:lipopolysaccharide biosynthesis glycosyltransferase
LNAVPTIATASDARYARPLAVLLRSVQEHLAPDTSARLFVLDGGLGRGRRARVERSLDPARLRLEWVRPGHGDVPDGLPVFGHISAAAYLRLLMPDALPADVGRVLYLDADTLALDDVARLWATDMAGAPLMAVPEQGQTLGSMRVPGLQDLGLRPAAPCLNSGVLLMDLDAWRREGLHQQVIEYLQRYRDEVRFWDQDGINAVLAGRWGTLDLRWNWRVDCGEPLPAGLTPAGWRDLARREAGIVHFASSAKPWHYYTEHPARALYLEWLDRTAWAGWRPRPPLRALLNKHYWGAQLRRVPGVGEWWARWRRR